MSVLLLVAAIATPLSGVVGLALILRFLRHVYDCGGVGDLVQAAHALRDERGRHHKGPSRLSELNLLSSGDAQAAPMPGRQANRHLLVDLEDTTVVGPPGAQSNGTRQRQGRHRFLEHVEALFDSRTSFTPTPRPDPTATDPDWSEPIGRRVEKPEIATHVSQGLRCDDLQFQVGQPRSGRDRDRHQGVLVRRSLTEGGEIHQLRQR